MEQGRQHVPVLYHEVVDALQPRPGHRYVDATLGAGGHAAGILSASAPDGRLLGLDADPEAISYARQVLEVYGDRVVFQVANFRQIGVVAHAVGFGEVDGILMDLGLSSRQLGQASRGFSFNLEGPLDMRIDRGRGRPASDLVNHLPEAELADLFWRFGEERYSRRIARAIVASRPVTTTGQLAEVVSRTVGRREKIHPATRVFQALRIAVNDELEALGQALPQARDLLRPGGRIAVIAFHSLEDRLVKRFFLEEARDCICPPEAVICVCQHEAMMSVLTRKPIRPTEDEVAINPPSRSARLRVAERLP